MKCRICGHSMIAEQEVPVKENLTEMISLSPQMYSERKMTIYYCDQCQHRQIDFLMDDTFYDIHDSVHEGAKQYYGELANRNKYIKNIHKYVKGSNILDVGCGQGDFLKVASKYFEHCCGIEPSSISYANRFKEKNIEYINDYFNTDLLLPKYEVIVSFQVLEHIVDVIGFVKAFYKYMKDDGIGVINVPNGHEIFTQPCFSQIVTQHVNYFSVFSLTTLLNDNGFEILEVENDIPAFEITVYFRKKKESKNIYVYIDELKLALNNELCMCNKIAIWGAGGRSASYASILNKKNKEHILHIFDNDDTKYNGYIGGINVPIEKPDFEKIQEVKMIVIFASAYNKEIIKELHEVYEYNGKIVYIENDRIFVE